MELIKRLNKLGISINLLEPDQLEIIADDNVLTDEILTDIKRCKQEIIDNLQDLKEKGKSNFAQVVEKKEYYRLSSAQKRMFFLQQLDTKAISYNVPHLFSLNGKIDIKKIERILKYLIERHEIFRTSFYILGMEPVQRVHKSVEFKLDYFEASTTEAKKIIKSYIKPFDLSKAPLIRSAIIKVSDDLYIWILDFHHIVTDGTTVNIIKEEFLTKYGDIELPILKYQYKDFSEFQNRLIESGEIARQEEYWLELYSDDIPTIALPEDFTRPEIFTFKGDDFYFTIDSKETNKLRKLAFEGGGTMYMSLLAALNALFYKYTKQTDIIIGCGVAGRKDSSFQRTAGMYVNSLAMRNYPSGERKFRDFLKEVIQNSINAFNNQDMQFEELVEKLKLDRDTSRNPIFDICMLIQNFEEIQEVADDFIQIFSDDNDLINQSEKRLASIFDMNFSIEDKADKIDVRLEYYTDVYKRSTIEKLVFHFKNLIKSICDNPEMRLDDVDILGQLEKQQILHEFNHINERFPSNKLIHEIFEEQADQYPDNVAILSGDEHLTYKELEGYSNQIAHYLKDGNSIEQGMVIGVYMDKCPSLIISILGILKIGCSYLPLSASYPEDRIIDMINDASACIVIGSKEYVKELNRFQWSCQSLNTYLCIDSFDIYQEIESLNSLNDRKLWEYVGEESFDDITGGGWTSSYSGLPIPKKEMDEYGENIVEKLTPLLTRETRILEIGCASGISMFRIAPKVGFYFGTDLSSVILDRNRIRIEEEGHNNIQLKQIPAHEIGEIDESDFDIVIINSVIQCFDGHNYLRRVIQQALGLMKDNGHIFLGDIMDHEKKLDLISDMKAFKRNNTGNNFKTKIDWSEELFLSRGFLEDLKIDLPQIASVDFSDKMFTIDNELTKFRFDALLAVNKRVINKDLEKKKNKFQHDANILTQFSKTRLKSDFSTSSVAYIIYTSGSTGKPKGAIIEHRNVINLLFNKTTKFDFNNRDVWTMFHSHSFDFSVWEMYGALLFGGKLVLIPRILAVDTEEYLNLLETKQVTILNQTPSVFNNIAELAFENDINLNFRYVILGGEALQLANLRSWLEKYPSHKLINMFGITEVTVHATYKELSLQDIQLGKSNIGKAIPGYQSYVMDGNMKIQPIGVVGELFIAGAGVSRGYLNKVELANKRFVENPFERDQKLYKTGDLARMLPNGDLEYRGRADDQVKIRGFRIELGEIENNILSKEEITKCVVIVKTDEQKNKYLCAYVVLVNSECDIDNLKLREYLSTYLPDYMIPSYFVAIDQIPLTVNGKVNRKLLPNHEIKAGKDYKAPGTKIENILVDIWSEVLKIPREEISVNANFFELGGHSLKATIVTSKIHKELDFKIPLKEIFRKSTILELSKYLEKREKSNYTIIKPVEKKEYYLASSVQKRMFIIQQSNPVSTAYNMPDMIVLPYHVDSDIIENTILSILNKHSSFRTYFETINGLIVQRIIDQCTFKLEIIKINQNEINEKIKQFIKPFNLNVAPLFRAVLFEIADQKKVIYFDMHHIISDGVSFSILENNFRQIIGNHNVKPLRLQYYDYTEWLNLIPQLENIRKQESFWLNKFSDEIQVLDLPTDYVRPKNRTFEGATVKFFLDNKETEFIKKIAKEQDLTLYMMMMSVFNILLAKLSGQDDIIVGTPVASRRHADLENVVGMFVNTLTIRSYPLSNKSIKDFMHEVKRYCLDAFENQEYSFEDLIGEISFKPDKNRNHLFDVIFNMLNQIDYKEEISNIVLNKHAKANVKFDINFKVLDNDKKLLCIIDYSTSLFKASTIDRYIEYLRKIISQLIENGINTTIGEVELISVDKKKNILNLFNSNLECKLKRNTIQESLMNSFENHEDRVAICTADFNITYSKLIEESNKIQQSILDKGCSRGDIVGVYSSNKIEIITSILAIINCGGVFVPLDTNIPFNRLRLMSEEVSLKYLIVGEGETSSISWFENSNGTEKSVILNSGLNFCRPKEINLEEFDGDDIVYIYFTSGSTGVPKAIAGSNKGLQHFIEWESKQFNVTENHKVSLFTNPGFDPFLRDVFVPLLNGGCIEIPNNLDIILSNVKLLNWINRYGVNLIHMVPSLFKTLTDSVLVRGDFKALNHVLLAGEQIPTNSIRNWYEKMGERIQLVNVYGPTETTLAKMFHLIRSEDTLKERIPVGKTIDGSEAIILDENLNICDTGISGEIHIRTPYRSKGYVNQPEFYNQMFISNPFNSNSKQLIYKTGDIGIQNSEGLIEIIGRKNNQVKIRGMRIELGDIEKTLLQLKGIKDVVAILSKSDNNNSFIIAYYVLKENAKKFGNINSQFDIKKEKISDIDPDKLKTSSGNADYCCVNAYKLDENNYNSFNEFLKFKIENSPNETAILNAKDSFSYQTINHLSNKLFKLIMEKYDDTGALSKFEQEGYTKQILIDYAKNEEEKNQFVQKSNRNLYGNNQTENKKIISLISEGYQNIAIYLAVVKLGMSYVSLDFTETEENLRFIIKDSESRLIICNNTTYQLAIRLRDKVNKNISIYNIDNIEVLDMGNDLSLEIQSGYGNFISYSNKQITQLKSSDLRQYLLRELPEYMVPEYFQEIEEIPHNNNGKVNRKALPLLKLTNDDYEAPSNDIEKRLVEIWSEVLDLAAEEISVMTDFIELGGHSLVAARVMALIHKEFNIEITLPDIFENQKIRELALLLSILDVKDNLSDCETVKEIYI